MEFVSTCKFIFPDFIGNLQNLSILVCNLKNLELLFKNPGILTKVNERFWE